MTWTNPLNLHLIPTFDSDFHNWIGPGQTVLPLSGHVGSFGHVRKHHIHEGVDLYCPNGQMVFAVELGVAVAVQDFTGINARPPSPWWDDTQAVLVEGASGVVVYGEIDAKVVVGQEVKAGQLIGRVRTVLLKDKGRPMSMLHLELHVAGTRDTYEWPVDGPRPPSLLDPTRFLIECIR